LFTLGPGLPAPKSSARQTWQILEQDLPQLRLAIKTLLYGEPADDLAGRIDAMLAGPPTRRYITPELALTTILLCFRDPDSHAGVQRMPKKEEKLHAMGLLPPLPETASVGERFVAYEEVLATVPARYGKDWDWAMRDGFYWSEAFERNLLGRTTAGGERESRLTRPTPDALERLAASLYVDAAFLQDIVDLLEDKRQVIFFGPPGTGKTYVAQKLLEWLAPEEKHREIVQFHPSYSYEDFVQGFRPFLTERQDLAYQLQPGPLLRLARRAAANAGTRFVLLIDEINRGNLPRIFGELLYLLEYRDQRISLMYAPLEGMRNADDAFDDQGRFALPENLWLVGTMNTADRSIGLIDAALRRRFHFVPFFPNAGPLRGLLRRWLEDTQPPEMQQVADWVDRLNERLRERFGRHLQVGHSYFMRETLTVEDVERTWATDIMPFLEDQLFDQEAELRHYTLAAIRAGDRGQDAAEQEEAGAAPSEAQADPQASGNGELVEYADDPAHGA
jgi:MoxR-like ATPase